MKALSVDPMGRGGGVMHGAGLMDAAQGLKPCHDQEFLWNVLFSMAGGLVVVNDDEQILLVNRRLLGLTGLDEAELIGQPVQVVLPRAGTFRPVAHGTAHEEDTWLRCKGGDIPVSLAHSPLEGARPGHIYVVIDVRERKATEEALREAQGALVAASRRAGMAEVATGVIHEVGNVLTTVNVGLGQLAAAEAHSRLASLERLCTWIQEIRSGGRVDRETARRIPDLLSSVASKLREAQLHRANELQRLLMHLTHLAKVVSSQQLHAQSTVLLEPTWVAGLVQECVDLKRSRIEGQGVRVTTVVEPTLRVTSDPHQLRLILNNLVANALDAMRGSDDRVLKISAEQDGDTVVFKVRDSGVGIPPDHLTRIFAHGFTTRREGHGFGLHSAANAATQLGGTLTAESDGPGTGAEFTLHIPDRVVAQ